MVESFIELAHGSLAPKIRRVTPPSAPERPRLGRRIALLAPPLTLAITAVETAQDVVRGGGPAVLWRSLAFNLVDWLAWAPFVVLIVLIGERSRLDAAAHRARNALVWIAMGFVSCIGVALLTGVMVVKWNLTPAAAMAVKVGLSKFLATWVLVTGPFNTLVFFSVAGLLHAVLAYDELRVRQLREADLRARATRAELSVLRMQLQPHFFFNALHTISSLMLTDVAAAQQVIASLGDLLRAAFDHTARQEVLVRDEIAFVQRYIDIQRARFRHRLDVQIRVPTDLSNALVPSFLLQPLVENAIRHGVEGASAGGEIWIDAERSEGELRLRVRDIARGAATVAPPDTLHHPRRTSGIGLSNIEARLAQLYGDHQSFEAGRDADGCFVVTIRLPYRIGVAEADLTPAGVPA